MIVEYIRYALKEHSPAALIEAYAEAAKHLAAAPECVDYELCQCTEEATSFVLRIRWLSADAHLKGFRKGAHFPPFLAAIRAFVPEIAEMRHYELTPIVGAGSSTQKSGEHNE